MATIQLQTHECEEGWLPPLCTVCGEPANEDEPIPHQFTYTPPWVWFLVIASPIIALIVAMILRRSRKVWMPMCEEHRGYWANRWWMNFGLFCSLLGMIGALVALADFNAPTWTFFAAVLAFLFTLIGCAIVSNNSVRPTFIDNDFCYLTNVSPDFKEQVAEQQQRDDEEYRERRQRRRDRRERDDGDEREK